VDSALKGATPSTDPVRADIILRPRSLVLTLAFPCPVTRHNPVKAAKRWFVVEQEHATQGFLLEQQL
jgi:hypothetical protein